MRKDLSQADFETKFRARVRMWREEKGWTAEQMAIVLNVPPERYRKYESRSMMPAYLFHKFCLVCDTELDNLILGTTRKPTNRASIESLKGRTA